MILHNLSEYLVKNKELIELVSNIVMSIGTFAAVIVALWLSHEDNMAKLKVYSLIGVHPTAKDEYLWLSCVNVGRQPIFCINFVFNPNRFRKGGIRAVPHPEYELKAIINSEHALSSPPCLLRYGDRLDQHFDFHAISGEALTKLLPNYKWLAILQLKLFWSVSVTTNIKEFNGKLSTNLIRKIINMQFPAGSMPSTKPAKQKDKAMVISLKKNKK
jgi:hypothetical protein